MTKEKLIEAIMNECAKDGEPVTIEEATEMAEMEIKAGNVKRYEQATVTKERKPRTIKKDEEKIEIIKNLYDFLLTSGEESATIVNEQREITFRDFSITLTRHRGKKK